MEAAEPAGGDDEPSLAAEVVVEMAEGSVEELDPAAQSLPRSGW